MTSVRLEHVVKRYGPVVAAEIEHLDIADGEVVALLGPSGCGKTTTLRIVAGLITQDEGTLAFGDRDVTLVPPERRNAAMVFQNYALFPHMTVYQNIAFGLEVRKFSRDKIKERVASVLELVKLPAMGVACRSSCLAGNNNASLSRELSRRSQMFCCSTNRSVIWMPSCVSI